MWITHEVNTHVVARQAIVDVWGFRVQALAIAPNAHPIADADNPVIDTPPAVLHAVAAAAHVAPEEVLDVRVDGTERSHQPVYLSHCGNIFAQVPEGGDSRESKMADDSAAWDGGLHQSCRFRVELTATLDGPLSSTARDVASYCPPGESKGDKRREVHVHTSAAAHVLFTRTVPKVAAELEDAAGEPRLRGASATAGALWLLHRAGVNFRLVHSTVIVNGVERLVC